MARWFDMPALPPGISSLASISPTATIGSNVTIGAFVTIGDDAVIGPGAVVMSSVPPCGVAMGNPARVIGWEGSFELVHYDNMENDPARKLALQSQSSDRAKEK